METLCQVVSAISIHALLAESDGVHYDNYNLHCVISIHALLAESDHLYASSGVDFAISIHALLAESDRLFVLGLLLSYISIHALLAESDDSSWRPFATLPDFYPRSPCGERPKTPCMLVTIA